ncbi:MAG: class I SAM-dependent methyltransferase [Gammaproteobacteria bacterium]|mgnify:CR=1 FL=1|nr:class I SAM-dependent methyltransferase [Gammaproteobacteria bacterium]MBT3859269.1 class I SAM-dependent methyltransferase [Gammaproteobacteria bacterium]MBT3987959.1 class I SAM-dependent methyltransferase [Gammaproteobacteria bacterium]MBT4256869.1 class I SAM-dependent methyltransferase [Gammaproteobacteria bacterium]MBT4658013.1 class I SAM-dependent methyltransferase [Gammaproteobacteria bacterium]
MKESICNCEEPELEPLFPVPDFDTGEVQRSLHCCTKCGLTQTYPIPSASEMSQIYNDNYYTSTKVKFNPVIEAWSRLAGRNRARKLLARNRDKSSVLNVLDFGCGRGVLLDGFRAEGHSVLGIERSDSMFDSLPDVSSMSLQELITTGRQFDIIVIWHVLEHLDDPEKTIAEIHQLLTDNGKLYIEVPNFGSIQVQLFGSHWFHLDIPRHLAHFTPASLSKLMERNGFKASQTKTFSFDQNLYGFFQSALNAIPFLPENHLYKTLKSGLSLKSFIILVLYSPLLVILLVPALLELLLSHLCSKGAVLSLELVKPHD